ncbi:MAG: aminopeptidase [Thermoplasmata archaeon]|nr:MAG: aminopeptidase [Thermoplasmata archaeon]RLF71265.1 MAG: aminopeptidase [Thermoplasmata archaeon]RLF74323.1 MAG: aminopeptidase [Thermoplasmata archaeon]
MTAKVRKKTVKKLGYERKSGWEMLDDKRREEMEELSRRYLDFLRRVKTEREAVRYFRQRAEEAGFKNLEEVEKLEVGDKVYSVNREKNIYLAKIGKEPLSKGVNIVAAHVDSPRLDLKQVPLYEDSTTSLALLRTHYYGGIKKYQWVSTPLALHGKVILADGSDVEVTIGEEEGDPVFAVPDLLPHLAGKKQYDRKTREAVKGEELQILVGSEPVKDEKVKKKVKENILRILHERYGMVEEDFISAELEAVPADRPREVGLDRSMIGGYGQDDRICSFTAFEAILSAELGERTQVVALVDKEEIGSEGSTGMKANYIEVFLSELLAKAEGEAGYRRALQTLSRSSAISADVNAAVNPIFKDVHEVQNAALLGRGVVVTKFTGSGGKYSANDATAEFVGFIRRLLNSASIPWQTGELGRVDEGGGGTIAKFLAEYSMDVIDMGPGLLAMHSPFEISSKVDLLSSYLAYREFLSSKPQ